MPKLNDIATQYMPSIVAELNKVLAHYRKDDQQLVSIVESDSYYLEDMPKRDSNGEYTLSTGPVLTFKVRMAGADRDATAFYEEVAPVKSDDGETITRDYKELSNQEAMNVLLKELLSDILLVTLRKQIKEIDIEATGEKVSSYDANIFLGHTGLRTFFDADTLKFDPVAFKKFCQTIKTEQSSNPQSFFKEKDASVIAEAVGQNVAEISKDFISLREQLLQEFGLSARNENN